MIINLDFLEYVDDEKALQDLYDNIRKNVNKISSDNWSAYDDYYDTLFEGIESRLDELADNVPYGSQDSGTEIGRYKTKKNSKLRDNK